MKKILCALALLCLMAGCERHEHPAPDANLTTGNEPPLHSENEGILLCDLTKASIGLKAAEVAERKEGAHSILVVPKSAVLNTTAGDLVFVENGERYKRAPVKVGRDFGDLLEITDGVYEGDTVVTGAAQTLWLIELRAIKGGKGCCPMPDAKKSTVGIAEHAH